jgi:hypothetical protein
MNTDTGGSHDTGTNRDGGGGGRDVVFMFPDTGSGGDSGGGGGTVPIYGACAHSSDCSGAGSACLTAFAPGICTRQCMTDGDCSGGVCIGAGGGMSGTCVPGCTPGGMGTCDQYGAACAPTDTTGTVGGCFPSCFTSGAPAGFSGMCQGSLQCDPYSGVCGTMPSTGADNGAACTMDSDCRGGRCVLPADAMSGQPTGFLGGYCLSFGRYPGDSAYTPGAPIPQSNCPSGSVAVSVAMGTGTGDSVPCFRACTGASGCRAGYACQHLGSGTMTTTNGICLPVDCTMTGMSCPSGTTCHRMTDMASGTMYGVCG